MCPVLGTSHFNFRAPYVKKLSTVLKNLGDSFILPSHLKGFKEEIKWQRFKVNIQDE